MLTPGDNSYVIQCVLEFGLWVSEEDWLLCGQLWPLSKPRWVVRVTRPVGEDQDWECPEVKRGAGGSWNITREELCVTWVGWVACSQNPRSILGGRWDLSTRRWLGVIQDSLEPTRGASVNCGCERHILLCETVFIGTIFIGHLYKGILCTQTLWQGWTVTLQM